MPDYFNTNQTCPMCSCSNKATTTRCGPHLFKEKKNKRSRKIKTTFPHQPLPRLLLLLNALLLAQLLGQRRDKVASNAIVLLLESAAIEDGVQDFPVSPEISISLAFFFVNCVFLFYIWFKFFLTILIITEEKKNPQKSNPSASPNPTS